MMGIAVVLAASPIHANSASEADVTVDVLSARSAASQGVSRHIVVPKVETRSDRLQQMFGFSDTLTLQIDVSTDGASANARSRRSDVPVQADPSVHTPEFEVSMPTDSVSLVVFEIYVESGGATRRLGNLPVFLSDAGGTPTIISEMEYTRMLAAGPAQTETESLMNLEDGDVPFQGTDNPDGEPENCGGNTVCARR